MKKVIFIFMMGFSFFVQAESLRNSEVCSQVPGQFCTHFESRGWPNKDVDQCELIVHQRPKFYSVSNGKTQTIYSDVCFDSRALEICKGIAEESTDPSVGNDCLTEIKNTAYFQTTLDSCLKISNFDLSANRVRQCLTRWGESLFGQDSSIMSIENFAKIRLARRAMTNRINDQNAYNYALQLPPEATSQNLKEAALKLMSSSTRLFSRQERDKVDRAAAAMFRAIYGNSSRNREIENELYQAEKDLRALF